MGHQGPPTRRPSGTCSTPTHCGSSPSPGPLTRWFRYRPGPAASWSTPEPVPASTAPPRTKHRRSAGGVQPANKRRECLSPCPTNGVPPPHQGGSVMPGRVRRARRFQGPCGTGPPRPVAVVAPVTESVVAALLAAEHGRRRHRHRYHRGVDPARASQPTGCGNPPTVSPWRSGRLPGGRWTSTSRPSTASSTSGSCWLTW